MLDSDGYVEPMITCWLDSGVDILFPMETVHGILIFVLYANNTERDYVCWRC